MNNVINTNWLDDPTELLPELAEEISEANLESASIDAAIVAREAYLAYVGGVFEEAPEALAAFLDHHLHLDV